MTDGEGAESRWPEWQWTLASGIVTILLALLALLLPVVEWAAKGGLVGWLLFAAGAVEFIFGARRGPDLLGVTAKVSGIMTAATGVLFIAKPLTPYLSVANIVMIWLGLRGAWILARAALLRPRPTAVWMGFSGLVDVVLAFLLAAGISVSGLVIMLFGPTTAIIAKFSLILMTSFLVGGISQIAIASLQRRQEPGS